MPRYKRIRVRGKQRANIDVDLLAQALIMASQDIQAAQQGKGSDSAENGQSGSQLGDKEDD